VTALDSIETLIQRFEQAKNRKTHWETLYKDAMDFVAPHRQLFYEQTEGQDKSNADRIFDSTAINALDAFVSNMQTSLVPPGRKWVELEPGIDVDPANKQEAAGALRMITEKLFAYLAVSNFDAEVSPAFSDLGIGVGALLIQKGTPEDPLRFNAVNIATLFLEEGPNGRVDTAFRSYDVSYRNILGTWPDAELGAEHIKLQEEKPNEKFTVIEGSIAGVYDQKTLDDNGKVSTVKKPGYRYVVIDKAKKTLLVDRIQASSPWVIFRWSTLSGDLYGRGPVLKALPDVKTINKTKELLLKGASRSVHGIWTVADDGVINLNNIHNIKPGTVFKVGFTGGPQAGLAELPYNGNTQLGQFIFNDLQLGINKTLFADALGRVDLPVKSASEIIERQKEMAKRTGSSFGRLMREFYIPLVNRCLYILDDLGLIDMGGFFVDGRVVNARFISPLAKSQQLEELSNMQNYASFWMQMLGPEQGLAMFNPEKLAYAMASRMEGVPDIVPTPEEFAAIKQAVQQQATMQGAQQAQEVMATQQALGGGNVQPA
jgi:hypothetical protein